MRGSASQSHLSVVLSPGPGGQGRRTFDAFQEPAWPLSEERHFPPALRIHRRALHGGGLVSANGFAVDASLIAADADKQRSVPSSGWDPAKIKDRACRAAREYLATLDDAVFGATSPVTLKFIARSDPAVQRTGAHKGHAFFAYATNYLIDTDHGVIVDVEASRHPAGRGRRIKNDDGAHRNAFRLEAELSCR